MFNQKEYFKKNLQVINSNLSCAADLKSVKNTKSFIVLLHIHIWSLLDRALHEKDFIEGPTST
jgi:hypothetical protein